MVVVPPDSLAPHLLPPGGPVAPPAPGDLPDLWLLDLAAPRDPEADLALLAPAERQRAVSAAVPDAGMRFAAGRAGLRRLLGAYLCVPPDEVPLRIGPEGKPDLREGEDAFVFNLSHSGDWVLYAVARAEAVGVDIERIRPGRDVDALARRVLSPGERAGFDALPEAARPLHFHRVWVRKEAYLKGLGCGLRRPFAGVCMVPDASGAATLLDERDPEAGQVWQVREVEAPTGCVASVAWRGVLRHGAGRGRMGRTMEDRSA